MPPGRPTKLNDTARTSEDGRAHTVAEEVVRYLRAGNYVETAAALAGVHKSTVHAWLKEGARARQRQEKGERLPRRDRELLAFSDAVERAMAEAEARDLARLGQLADGGVVVKTETVRTDAAGKVIEKVVKEEATLPDARVLEWRLERRFPKKWGRRRLEVTGGTDEEGNDLPIPVRVEVLADRLRQLRSPGGDDDGDDEEGALEA